MSRSEVDRVLVQSKSLREDLDRREQEAEASRPDAGVAIPGLPQELAHAERRAILGALPRKSLWPKLNPFNEQVAALQVRQLEVEQRMRALHDQRVNAPSVDARAAADWEVSGRQGPRPEPSVERIDAEIADGLLAAIDRALEDRGRFVEKNRSRLGNVAAQRGDAVVNRITQLLDEVERERATLAELRQAEVWVRLFPHELASREPLTRLFGGGLKHVSEPLGISAQVDYSRLVEAVRADASSLRNAAATAEQRALLEGRDPRASKGAVWADSPEHRAEANAELEAAVQAFRQDGGATRLRDQLVAFIRARGA